MSEWQTEVFADKNDYNSDSDVEANEVEFNDLDLFFHAIGEPQLVDLFVKNKVTLGQLLTLDEQDLINCGVELVGDRKKILASTAQMHCEKWSPSSLQDLTAETLLSSPGIYIALNDINKHLEYIGVTFRYLRRRLQCKPQMLELGKDYVGVGKIVSEIEDLLITSKSTHNQLQALKQQLCQHSDDPILKPVNNIDENYVRRAKIKKKIGPVLVAAIAICFSIKLSKLFN